MRLESFIVYFSISVSLLHPITGLDLSQAKSKNFEELYSLAKEAYLANDWNECVQVMELTLQDYKEYNQVVTQCKIRCRRHVPLEKKLHHRNIESLFFFEEVVRNTLCIMKCKRKAFGRDRVEQISAKVLQEFDERLPYDYLQLCYFQVWTIQIPPQFNR